MKEITKNDLVKESALNAIQLAIEALIKLHKSIYP